VAPVRKQISEASSHVSNAQTHAQKAKESVADAKAAAKVGAIDLNRLHVALDLANQEIDALTQELNVTQQALAYGARASTELQGKINDQTDSLNKANDEKNRALKAADDAERRYHHLKFWVCALAAVAAGLLVFRLKALLFLIPPPYNFIVGAAVPVAVFGFLWLRL